MLRIHLAQILFNPSYYDSPVDFLEEPCFSSLEKNVAVGNLRANENMQSFLLDLKSSYIEHLRTKILDIAIWSGKRETHLLVFPEYSVPVQILTDLQEIASKFSMVIVAGTHRVLIEDEAKSIYEKLQIFPDSLLGYSIAPIFLPDGTVRIVKKLRKSKWEPNLSVSNENPEIIDVKCRDESFRLSVIACIDCLHPEVVGTLWKDRANAPHVIVCPSFSPSTDPFKDIGSIALLQETLFAFVNTAVYGGTSVNLPDSWKPFLKGHSYGENLPKEVEAVLELDVDIKNLFIKKGSIVTTPVCNNPVPFPIIYAKDADWIQLYLDIGDMIEESITKNDKATAIDLLDSYLTEEAVKLPELVLQKLKYFRHGSLPLYDGDIESLKMVTELVKISESIEDTKIFWSKRINCAIHSLTDYLKVCTNEILEILLTCIQNLKRVQQQLPPVGMETIYGESGTFIIPRKEKLAFSGEENLIEAFQNRGADIDKIRNCFSNKENRVIVITGAIGIGKSDFVNWMFRKAFGDWEIIRVKVPSDARMPRILADIGYQLGIPIDVDSLATSSHKIFRQKVRKLLSIFYSFTKRALIIDDLHEILKARNMRDHRQLATFIEEAIAPENYIGGRVFLISSQWLPEKWLTKKGISYIRLKRISDRYTQRIIEYHMRQNKLLPDEAPLEAPQQLLNLIKGHPLSATLVSEVLQDSDIDLDKLSNELTIGKVSGHIAHELLKRVDLSLVENLIMKRISIFRLPLRIDLIKNMEQFDISEEEMLSLAERCIINFDGEIFEMHEAVRRFYYDQIAPNELKDFHGLAALYYTKIYENQKSYGIKDPSIIAELVHHLSMTGNISEIKNMRVLVVQEIKPAARKVYREQRNWDSALSLYKVLEEIVPDDPEVEAYIGRCYARLGQWGQSDEAFEKAISISSKTGSPIWWIYRDWGHIRARYNFYSEAKDHFDKASEFNPNDASINASLAFMSWKQGETDLAYDLFEKAINLNPYHEYTLTFYPKFIESTGENSAYARILRERLIEIQSGDKYIEPVEYDLEVESFDDE